jgi:hypothetical protein
MENMEETQVEDIENTIQPNFLPHLPYLFTIQLIFLPYFPYHFTIFFCIFQIFSLLNLGLDMENMEEKQVE